uniref:Uncharacterized protein n=1 Tax=Sphaerodactylus townsendi TaxID=933632 RepID=A0ACB8GC91_9SAUR
MRVRVRTHRGMHFSQGRALRAKASLSLCLLGWLPPHLSTGKDQRKPLEQTQQTTCFCREGSSGQDLDFFQGRRSPCKTEFVDFAERTKPRDLATSLLPVLGSHTLKVPLLSFPGEGEMTTTERALTVTLGRSA